VPIACICSSIVRGPVNVGLNVTSTHHAACGGEPASTGAGCAAVTPGRETRARVALSARAATVAPATSSRTRALGCACLCDASWSLALRSEASKPASSTASRTAESVAILLSTTTVALALSSATLAAMTPGEAGGGWPHTRRDESQRVSASRLEQGKGPRTRCAQQRALNGSAACAAGHAADVELDAKRVE
jgi:hypothetical protein